jgi:hypothetical protein
MDAPLNLAVAKSRIITKLGSNSHKLKNDYKLFYYGGTRDLNWFLEQPIEELFKNYKITTAEKDYMQKNQNLFNYLSATHGGGFKISKKWKNIGLIGLLIVSVLFLILAIVFVFTDNMTGLKVISMFSSVLLVVVCSSVCWQYKKNNPVIVNADYTEEL